MTHRSICPLCRQYGEIPQDAPYDRSWWLVPLDDPQTTIQLCCTHCCDRHGVWAIAGHNEPLLCARHIFDAIQLRGVGARYTIMLGALFAGSLINNKEELNA